MTTSVPTQEIRPGALVRTSDSAHPLTVLRVTEDFGYQIADLIHPPARLWGQEAAPPPFVPGIELRRLQRHASPADLLGQLPPGDSWPGQSRRAIARLSAFFLIGEDPQRRLDTRQVNTLAHQVSLVRHVLDSPNLVRVLIGDEVGLGKTVEAGLILRELLARNPALRVLYLAPARLARNVRVELNRLDLAVRLWVAGEEADANLSDPRLVASIHRAVHGRNFNAVANSPPWDVLIVDECHHLNAWGEDGADPTLKYRLVKQLIDRLRPDARVILLSGTPHQGHATRFENLLDLLRRPNETDAALAGRIVYRTKEDVRDWEGQPLFPGRQVNPPTVVDLGADYRAWLVAIRAYYAPVANDNENTARVRAAGWRVAQALQWATSSPQAGLGYLVRQALRAGWTLARKALAETLPALRPYRGGRIDEPIERLYERLRKEVEQQQREPDSEELEDTPTLSSDAQADEALAELLQQGLMVLKQGGDAKWERLRQAVLVPAGNEKVVLFAQPLETVAALADYLARALGQSPALIVGGQSDDERERQVRAFRDPAGPRYLVSSRAGGEGINLQVSRRLVHLDVPWNPMEMEQRVGRVHRFGSRQTILVDTLVVRDSREADAYRVAREKLHHIASTVVEPERFETLFSRVMCLIPPEELLGVLAERPCGPLNAAEQDRLGRLVQAGFRDWNDFHQRFARQQQTILQQDPGQATWADLASLLRQHGKATEVTGGTADRFRWVEGQAEPVTEPACLLQMPGGPVVACGDYAGTLVRGPTGQLIEAVGLNRLPVPDILRRLAFPDLPTGAAHLGWPRNQELPVPVPFPVGVLVLLRQTIRPEVTGAYVEHACRLYYYLVVTDGEPIPIEGNDRGRLVRSLNDCVIRQTPPATGELTTTMRRSERTLIDLLIRPDAADLEHRRRHAVTPLFAAILTPT